MHDNLILIHSVDGQWETSFTASEACTGWKDSDTLKIKDSFLMSGSIDDNGVVTLRAPLDCYGPGYTIWVQIENITQGNWRQIPVNFTNRDIPTFRSQEDYAFVLDYIGQPLARSADVYIDSSLDSIPYLSDDTIKTFEDSMKARMEAMGEYFENPVAEPAVESLNQTDPSALDNSDRFYTVGLSQWGRSVSVHVSDIDPSWRNDDAITAHTVFQVDYNSSFGTITFTIEEDLFPVGYTIIVDVLNETQGKSREIFLNFSDDAKLKFESEEEAHLYGIFDESLYDIVAMPEAHVTTPATKYQIYTPSGTLYSNRVFENPYVAIQFVATSSVNMDGYSVKQTNDLVTVFTLQKNVYTKFYKFQFTQYYGVTDQAGAEQWHKNYGYIHLVRSDGIWGYNDENTNTQPDAHSYNYFKLKPDPYMLEGSTGGHVSVRPLSYNGYRVMKATVRLSQSTVDKNGMVVNPYVFMSSSVWIPELASGASCDLGLIYINDTSGYQPSGWCLCKNSYKNGFHCVGKEWVEGDNLAEYDGSDDRGNNGKRVYVTYSNNLQDVELTYTFMEGKVLLVVKNLATGQRYVICDIDSNYANNQTYIGLAAVTSFVPVSEKTSGGLTAVSDIKSGASFKNITWENLRVATNESDTFYNLGPNSQYLHTLAIYDTDSTTFTYSGNTFTVNIWYNSTYK